VHPSSIEATSVIGRPLREHRTRWTNLLVMSALGAVLIAGGIASTVVTGAMLREDASGANLFLGALVTLPFLGGGGVLLAWVLRRTKRFVTLHEGGFFYKDASGEWVVPWSSVEGVYHKMVRLHHAPLAAAGAHDVYEIALRDGTKLEVDHYFEDLDAFGTTLNNTLTALLLPGYRQAFHAGQSLDFGALRIDAQRIHAGGKSLSWNEVDGLASKEGMLSGQKTYLHVKKRGALLAWTKLPLERIKNHQALMALVREIGKAG
jgi:hypothetical protein